ncbi:MAG TPA: cytochrome c-type biogenesis protein [Methylomirabilota bacterium]|nr:cytochrome c-type biogenesis protein [Methylomirabilota bacterium]
MRRSSRCSDAGAARWRTIAALGGALVTLATLAWGQPPARPLSDETAYQIASELRCVVCQNLSVADSPSEMAAQMRAIVRERLAAGDSPEQVREYFVARYGEWILLKPRRSGFNLVVWGFPIAAVLLGLVAVGVLLRRWTRRPAGPAARLDAAMSERIRRELEREP